MPGATALMADGRTEGACACTHVDSNVRESAACTAAGEPCGAQADAESEAPLSSHCPCPNCPHGDADGCTCSLCGEYTGTAAPVVPDSEATLGQLIERGDARPVLLCYGLLRPPQLV